MRLSWNFLCACGRKKGQPHAPNCVRVKPAKAAKKKLNAADVQYLERRFKSA